VVTDKLTTNWSQIKDGYRGFYYSLSSANKPTGLGLRQLGDPCYPNQGCQSLQLTPGQVNTCPLSILSETTYDDTCTTKMTIDMSTLPPFATIKNDTQYTLEFAPSTAY